MKLRQIGKSGLQVSVVGLGCNNFGMRIDFAASRTVIHRALDLGVTLFDTADTYGNYGGSEEILGKVLGTHRKSIVLATKVGKEMNEAGTMKGASRAYIMSEVDASLRRLKTDYIDLYQIHAPDPETPIEETLGALNDLIHQGKVRYIGCSNFPAVEVEKALRISQELEISRFDACQDEYSLLARAIEKELIPVMESHNLGLLPYFPLASGLLTGKYRRNVTPPEGTRLAAWKSLAQRYATERNWEIVGRLKELGEKRGYAILELAFGWLLSKPVVSSVIAGATRPEQVEQNIAAAVCSLSPEDLAELDAISG